MALEGVTVQAAESCECRRRRRDKECKQLAAVLQMTSCWIQTCGIKYQSPSSLRVLTSFEDLDSRNGLIVGFLANAKQQQRALCLIAKLSKTARHLYSGEWIAPTSSMYATCITQSQMAGRAG